MRWADFASSAPELAGLGEQLFRSTGLCLVATIKADGWPRISPCEVILEEGELFLGMMWRSRKALDLLRDPRITVHSAQCDPKAAHGDFKVYGRAREILDDGTDPTRPRPSHLFAIDIERTAYINFGVERVLLRWESGKGLSRLPHPRDADASAPG